MIFHNQRVTLNFWKYFITSINNYNALVNKKKYLKKMWPTFSRSSKSQKNGVKAPMSKACVPMTIKWFNNRVISANMALFKQKKKHIDIKAYLTVSFNVIKKSKIFEYFEQSFSLIWFIKFLLALNCTSFISFGPIKKKYSQWTLKLFS